MLYLFTEKTFVNLQPMLKVLTVTDSVEEAFLRVSINAFPQPTLKWYHDGKLVENTLLQRIRCADGCSVCFKRICNNPLCKSVCIISFNSSAQLFDLFLSDFVL